MACFSSGNIAFTNPLNIKKYDNFKIRRRYEWALCCETSRPSTSLVVQMAKMLGPGARFQASKLKVVFSGAEVQLQEKILPRIYTISHCDLTANLTLAISTTINFNQLSGWFKKVLMDDVIGEWKEEHQNDMSLHVHCHVSGAHPLLDLAAEFRYYIFTKELPLALKAVIHGDSELFNEKPKLMDSIVWVHFHSSSYKYNRLEYWGPLKAAAEVNHPMRENTSTALVGPNSIFHAISWLLL